MKGSRVKKGSKICISTIIVVLISLENIDFVIFPMLKYASIVDLTGTSYKAL